MERLAEIELTKRKNNLPLAEREALNALKRDTIINLKKADKGTTTVTKSWTLTKNATRTGFPGTRVYSRVDSPISE